MIYAQHREAVERNVRHELPETLAHRLASTPVVEMLGVHVRDDGHRAGQPQEGAVAFICLHHHPLARTLAGVGAIGVDDAAIDDGGVEPRRLQHGRDQRSRRRLAVRATDRDGPFQAHQLSQHFGTPHHGQHADARGLDLRIVAPHRGRGDDDLRRAQVFRRMADGDGNARGTQPRNVGTLRDVAALHRVAEIVQHLGDARHADAADADKMDRSDGERQRAHLLALLD